MNCSRLLHTLCDRILPRYTHLPVIGWGPFDPPLISLKTLHMHLQIVALSHALVIKVNICIVCGEKKKDVITMVAAVFSQRLHGTLPVLLCGHTAAHCRFPHNYCTQTDVKGSQNKIFCSLCPAQFYARFVCFNHRFLLFFLFASVTD